MIIPIKVCTEGHVTLFRYGPACERYIALAGPVADGLGAPCRAPTRDLTDAERVVWEFAMEDSRFVLPWRNLEHWVACQAQSAKP